MPYIIKIQNTMSTRIIMHHVAAGKYFKTKLHLFMHKGYIRIDF